MLQWLAHGVYRVAEEAYLMPSLPRSEMCLRPGIELEEEDHEQGFTGGCPHDDITSI